jgi:hypothetical protein
VEVRKAGAKENATFYISISSPTFLALESIASTARSRLNRAMGPVKMIWYDIIRKNPHRIRSQANPASRTQQGAYENQLHFVLSSLFFCAVGFHTHHGQRSEPFYEETNAS